HANEDAKRKEVIETKNVAEQMIYTAEKAVKDNGDKVTPEVVTEINEKIELLKKAREGEDMDAIKSASESLSTSLSKIGEAMMQEKKDGEAPSGQETPEEAKEAEFKEGPIEGDEPEKKD
ncbi:Hsp70 family protein, partial [Patescibacteria group bacterium]|nr:Hsp70 family protein [Patescibacteria group bacterium]MBU1754936.1 Hsp70 family protein [Patescibacteria group bacterium]